MERLEQYWEQHRLRPGETLRHSGTDSPLSNRASASNRQLDGQRLCRAVSDAAALTGAPQLFASYHPALSLGAMMQLFGPLIFRLYRAALLRKRILLVGDAPVHRTCDFGKGSKGSRQLYSLMVRSLRSFYPAFGPQITLTATAYRWYRCIPITAFVQCWGAGYSPAL